MKQLKTLFVISLLGSSLVAMPAAHAKDNGRAKKTAKASAKKAARTPAKQTVKKKVKEFDFMADEIEAGRIRPDGTAIFGLQTLEHKSLIRLRSEFIGEILKSAEML